MPIGTPLPFSGRVRYWFTKHYAERVFCGSVRGDLSLLAWAIWWYAIYKFVPYDDEGLVPSLGTFAGGRFSENSRLLAIVKRLLVIVKRLLATEKSHLFGEIYLLQNTFQRKRLDMNDIRFS